MRIADPCPLQPDRRDARQGGMARAMLCSTAAGLASDPRRANAFDAALREACGRSRWRPPLPSDAEAGLVPTRERDSGPGRGSHAVLAARFEAILAANSAAPRRGVVDAAPLFGWIDAADDDVFAVASAASAGSAAVIGLAQGSPRLFADAFACALADPSVLPDLGDPRDEAAKLAAEGGLRLRVVAARHGEPAGPKLWHDAALRPVDAVRAHAADVLARLALEFQFLHASQHVFGAHFDVARAPSSDDRSPPRNVFANAPRRRDAELARARRELECHADSFAAACLARMLVRGNTLLLDGEELLCAALEPERALCIAMFVVFLLEAEGAAPDSGRGDWDHPSPLVRLCAVADVVASNLVTVDASTADAWRGVVPRLVETLRELCLALRPVHPFVKEVFHDLARCELEAQSLMEGLRARSKSLRWKHELIVPD